MREHVTLEVAHRLFDEARNFTSGRKSYMAMESEIRQIAVKVFGKQAYRTHLDAVCNQIFYMLACDFKGTEP